MPGIHLIDGRYLAWREWGAPDGRPVIYCPGAGMTGLLPFGQAEAGDLGLRIIAVDRPGLGHSSADPGKSLDSWTHDVAQLVDQLGLGAVLTLGFSQGAPFALALAAGGLADAVAIVSGQDELALPELTCQLPDPVAAMVRRAAQAPRALEAEIAATATPGWLWQMIETFSGPADRAFYAAEGFAPLYRAALDEGFRQGAAGYARDTVLAMAPWSFRAEALGCPVGLWFGLADTSPVHSPDFGATLAARLPAAHLTQLAGEGSAILWTRAGEILGALARAA